MTHFSLATHNSYLRTRGAKFLFFVALLSFLLVCLLFCLLYRNAYNLIMKFESNPRVPLSCSLSLGIVGKLLLKHDEELERNCCCVCCCCCSFECAPHCNFKYKYIYNILIYAYTHTHAHLLYIVYSILFFLVVV